MTAITDKTVVPYENPEWVPVLPTRWVAEYDGEVAGGIDRTPGGKYRATDRNGRRVGSFRTLAEARDALEAKNSTTAIQRMNQSRTLLIGGLAAFLATATVATMGIISLLTH
ncbi:MAG: hypothetical protein KF801_02245 [Cryobacterium sp.]|jgi:hypothetical protein|nr:hypothetical protein [Cryobacterium sp.]